MLGKPLWEVDLPSLKVAREQGIASKDIGDDREISIPGKVIGKQLAIDRHAKDITDQDNGLFGSVVVLRVGKVGRDCKEMRPV